jgi:protein translocase SecG subunit
MSVIHIALLCAFVFLCFLIISSILLQTGKGGGMAGLGGGASDSAFGAHTANVLQKFTMYCVIAFFVLVVVLGKTQKGASDSTSVMEGFVAPQPAVESTKATEGEGSKLPPPVLEEKKVPTPPPAE